MVDYNKGETCYSLTAVGDYVYLACGTTGVKIVDITSPTSPLTYPALSTLVSAVAVYKGAGSYVYVADSAGGVMFLNAVNPITPSVLLTYNTSGTAVDVTVDGSIMYVADTTGLRVVSLQDMANPVLLGEVTNLQCLRVVARGGMAYVTGGTSGTRTVDARTPASPVITASLLPTNLATATYDLALVGDPNYLLTVTGAGGLTVLNISSPSAQQPVKSVVGRFDGQSVSTKPGLVAVTGLLYKDALQSVSCLRLYNSSNPTQPQLLGSLNSTTPVFGNVYVSGNYVYIACRVAGVYIVNITNPTAPAIVSYYDTPGTAESVTVVGTLAYVADGIKGILVMDVSQPSSPRLVSSYITPAYTTDVAIQGNIAYLAQTNHLNILDITTLSNMIFVAYNTTKCESILVQNQRVYCSAGAYGMYILDATVLASPVALSTTPPSFNGANRKSVLSASGTTLYIANDSGGLTVLDVTTGSKPVVLQSEYTLGLTTSVAIEGQYLYFSNQHSGINVWGIEQPQTTGAQTTGLLTTGAQTTGKQTTGQQTTGGQTTGKQTTGVQQTTGAAGVTTAVQTTGKATTGSQSQTTGAQSQTTGQNMQTTGVPAQTTGAKAQTTGGQAQTTGGQAQTTGAQAQTTGTTAIQAQTTGAPVQTTGTPATDFNTTSADFGISGASVLSLAAIHFIGLTLLCTL